MTPAEGLRPTLRTYRARRRDRARKKFRIGEQVNSFARGETVLGMLVGDGLRSATLADVFAFVADLGHKIGEKAHVGFEASRGGIDLGRQQVRG